MNNKTLGLLQNIYLTLELLNNKRNITTVVDGSTF